MIARLRTRHRWMWVGLLVVAPGVLAAALSVRRGEAARQEIPLPVLSPMAPSNAQSSADLAPGEWRCQRDAASDRKWLWLRRDSDLLSARGRDVVLYWCRELTPEIDDYLYRFPSTDEERQEKWLALDGLHLPQRAVLLGAWAERDVQVFAVPEDFPDSEGVVLLWFDLSRSVVVDVQWAPSAVEPSR